MPGATGAKSSCSAFFMFNPSAVRPQGTLMRKLVLLAALFSPLAMAQAIIVAPHSLMRLPGNSSVLQVERLEVADYGTLLIPAGIDDVKIGELVLVWCFT
ncbi:hypothetical protein ALP60_04600, partial [Pseudomonas savastanoi]